MNNLDPMFSFNPLISNQQNNVHHILNNNLGKRIQHKPTNSENMYINLTSCEKNLLNLEDVLLIYIILDY
jgi:hypothetical protein